MNHWYQVRRLRGAVILITIGVLALLSEWHVMRWDVSWPLILIVVGLLKLAERAAWTADLRDQQAQGFGTPAGGMGTMGMAAEHPVPPDPANPSYWPPVSSSVVPEEPLIQPHPPAPEDSGREDR